jgi:predicted nucleic acid-binding protein
VALTHLVDTSVLTRLRHAPVRAVVEPMAAAGSLGRGRKIPDLLVAAAAEAADLVVLHYDADFDRIAALTRQPVEWVVRAGSVD